MIKVLSLGGSIVAPNGIDAVYLASFVKMAKEYLDIDASNKLIIVVGGGATARSYQNECKKVLHSLEHEVEKDALDWIGIMATRLNAQVVKTAFTSLSPCDVVINPKGTLLIEGEIGKIEGTGKEDTGGRTEGIGERVGSEGGKEEFKGRVLVAAGWKPGFSTDNDAVLLAIRFGAKEVLNLSNIDMVYTADPKVDKNAKPISKISWQEFCKIVGEDWDPGKNAPFDPIASKAAREAGLTVICANGRNNSNTFSILTGQEYVGTTIS